jgi:LuxR family maltose regulon positive regulatory protein
MNEISELKVPRGFLRRKFSPPKLPESYIVPSKQTNILDDSDSWRVCLVNATAGYGKSSLLAYWNERLRQKEGYRTVWVTLDHNDGNPLHFARSLAISLQVADPAFLELAESIDEEDGDIEQALVSLINLLDDTAVREGGDYVAFLDGYDETASNSLDEAILFINRYSPSTSKLVIAGNHLPAAICDMLLEPDAIEVGTSDLELDDEQLMSLGAHLMPGVPSAELSYAVATSDHWPTALSFYALARRRAKGQTEALRLLEGYYGRFFKKTVLNRVEPSVQQFLIETSLVDPLDAQLCDWLTDGEGSDSVLFSLAEQNRFVVYDPNEDVYRCQPLFRSYLQSVLLSMDLGYVFKLARRAAQWYWSHGKRLEMARCLAIAADPTFLEASIAGTTGLFRPQGFGSLTEYLIHARPEEFSSNLFLVWTAMWSTVSFGLVDAAREFADLAAELDGRNTSNTAAEYAEGICLALEGKTAESLSYIETILEREGSSLPSAFQCLLIHMQAEDQERLGKLEESRQLYERALALSEREESPFYRLFDWYLLARQQIDLGNLDDALSIARRALSECSENSALFGEFNAILAYVYIARNELSEAEPLVRRASGRVSLESNVDMYVDVGVCKCRLLQAQGKYVQAFETVSEVVRNIAGKTVPRHLDIEAFATQAVLAVRLGETAAINSCEAALDSFAGNPDVLRAIPCLQAKAAILHFRGQVDECLELLEHAREKAAAISSQHFLAEIALFIACVQHERGNEDRAMDDLGRAVELSMRAGFFNVFVKGLPPTRDLLLKMATSRKTSLALKSFAKRALAQMGEKARVEKVLSHGSDATHGYYSLTEREREVLHYLNAGMSRREIAEHFSVSQNTIKSHLKNIYAKLGVHTRAEAYDATPASDELQP